MEPVLSPEGEREVERVMALFEQTDDAAAIYHAVDAVDAADDAKYAAARTALVDALQRAEAAVRALVAQREDAQFRYGRVGLFASLQERRAEQAEAQVARLADGLRGLQARTGGFAHGSWEAQLNGTINDLLASLDGGATEGKG